MKAFIGETPKNYHKCWLSKVKPNIKPAQKEHQICFSQDSGGPSGPMRKLAAQRLFLVH